jgi:hypothetical protein
MLSPLAVGAAKRKVITVACCDLRVRRLWNDVMSPTVPQAVQPCYDLLLWLIPQLDRFPQHLPKLTLS